MQTDCGNFSSIGAACTVDIAEMSREVGNVNVYDIYDVCINDYAPAPPKEGSKHAWRRPPTKLDTMMAELGGPVECIDGGAAEAYLNIDAVRTAIHVKSQAQIWHLGCLRG